MTPISFPDDDIYEDGVVVSIQPNVHDEFSVQIQIQSLSITDDNLSNFLRIMSINESINQNSLSSRTTSRSISLQITCLSMHTDIQQLFLLIKIPPTVDKYYDNDK